MARAILRALAEEERLNRVTRLERRVLREESRPLSMPQRLFKKYYRLTKTQFAELCIEIIPYLPPRQRQRTTRIQPEIQILAAIAFYAHGSYQKGIGAMTHLGLSQSSVSECLRDVTEALNNPNILRKYIKFPSTEEERENIALQFMVKFGFPGVLGCVDGTHVAIIRPAEREEDFYNRKEYHSLNVMIICDSDLIIRYVNAKFGGAAHDSYVWNNSPVKSHMERLHQQQKSYWLLGDSGYAQRPWMMQPILRAAPNSPEEYYTNIHCSTRNVVERCIGVLKTRWRCLMAHRVLHYHPIKAGKITNACVVLHNFIKDNTLNIDQEELQRDIAHQPLRVSVGDGEGAHADGGRSALVTRLWESRTVRLQGARSS